MGNGWCGTIPINFMKNFNVLFLTGCFNTALATAQAILGYVTTKSQSYLATAQTCWRERFARYKPTGDVFGSKTKVPSLKAPWCYGSTGLLHWRKSDRFAKYSGISYRKNFTSIRDRLPFLRAGLPAAIAID